MSLSTALVMHSGRAGILNGCDLKTLSTVMGHTNVRQTEHYLHLAAQKSHLASAMRTINGRRPDARETSGSYRKGGSLFFGKVAEPLF